MFMQDFKKRIQTSINLLDNNQRQIGSFFQLYLHEALFFPLIDQLLMEKEVTFVRHAESQINLWMQSPQNFISQYPKNPALYDPPITLIGFQQCQRFRSEKSFDVCYVSPATRCLQTYENIEVSAKEVIVASLIRERNRIRAAVVGKPKELLALNFPTFNFTQIKQFWWRWDNIKHSESKLRRQPDDSVYLRLGFFLLSALIRNEHSLILVIGHSFFLDVLHQLNYFQRPQNCVPYRVNNLAIRKLFQKISNQKAGKL